MFTWVFCLSCIYFLELEIGFETPDPVSVLFFISQGDIRNSENYRDRLDTLESNVARAK